MNCLQVTKCNKKSS